jgi:hypothetical protein
VVECTALEMRHTGNRIGGSNPSLSATTSSAGVRERPINPMVIDFFVHSASVLVR